MDNSELKIFCDGEEIDTLYFDTFEDGDEAFHSYPVDDMADHIELWGFDSFGDWGLLDERDACSSP